MVMISNSRSCRCVLLILLTLTATSRCVAQQAEPAAVPRSDRESLILWGRERDGLQAGAYLLSSTGWLQPGDPIVVQFVLRNVSDVESTVTIQSFQETHPVLGENNRIALNILGSNQEKTQYVLKPGEVINRRGHRVVVSTAGLASGQYSVDANVAFWMSKANEPNSASGLGHGIPISVPIGDKATWPQPYVDEPLNPTEGIHWGKPVGGLIVGMRLKHGDKPLAHDAILTGDLFAKNVSTVTVEFEYEIPAATDWNMSLESAEGESVRLDSVWYSGFRVRRVRKVTLAPLAVTQLTGIPNDLAVEKPDKESVENRIIESPAIRILAEKAEFKYGDLPRLITGPGKYRWATHVTVRQTAVTDLDMVIGASEIPFEVAAD